MNILMLFVEIISSILNIEVNNSFHPGSPVQNVDDFAPDGGLDAGFLDDDAKISAVPATTFSDRYLAFGTDE